MASPDKEPPTVGVIVGLGNPGSRYEKTRHNVGFLTVDEIGRRFSVPFQERMFRAFWGTASISGRRVVLVKPLTYMNRSGEAVAELMRYFRFVPEQILVIHDDLDLASGRLRLARRGGAGGHRGIQSIIQHLGSQDFPRLKLGIGRPMHRESVEAYVLDAPYGDERHTFDEMVRMGADIAEFVVAESLDAAMNRFNQKPSACVAETDA